MSYAQFNVGDEVRIVHRGMLENWVGTVGIITEKSSDRELSFQPTSGPGFDRHGSEIRRFLATVTTLEFVYPEMSDIPEPLCDDLI